MFASYDVVLHYDRSRGVRATRGGGDWSDWLAAARSARERTPMTLLREPGIGARADRSLPAAHAQPAGDRRRRQGAARIAVVIEFAEFVVPRGDALQLGGPFAANVVKVLGWANDPAIAQANIVTVLVSEGLHDLNALVVENPHAAALHVPLPDEAEMLDVRAARSRRREFPTLAEKSEVPIDALGRAADRPQPRRRAHGDRAGAAQRQDDHRGVAQPA